VPLIKLQFTPGVNREATTLANEGGWYDCNNIRFRSGYPEKIGGWITDAGTTTSTLQPPTNQGSTPPTGYTWTTPSFWGICNNLWAWLNLSGYNLLGLGTNLKYYIQNGINGYFYDVTPLSLTTTNTATFSATTGSTTITVTDNSNGVIVNDFVTFSGATSLGGAITATILNAEFQVVSVTGLNTYTITSSVAATSSDTGNGGGAVVCAYQINTGNAIYTQALGWGAGPWGGTTGSANTGGWGQPATVSTIGINIRLWASANYGQNLVINSRGGGLYYWVVDTTATNFNRAQQLSATNTNTQNGAYAWFTDGAIFTGSIASGGTLTVTAVTTGFINIGATITGGSIPVNTTITGQTGTTSGGVGTYTISNTGITQASTTITATLNTCPTICNFVMVSDQSNFVIAFGCNDPGGYVTSSTTTADPLLVRWTDQQNILSWYPTITNQAGSQRLSQGSTIVTAIQTRQEILVFTDTALYSMQYLGPPYVWGFQTMGYNISIISPNCVAVANNATYWMGFNKFYFYNGTVQTLPCAVRQYIFNNLNYTQSQQIFSGTNEAFNEIWWFYCSVNSTTVDSYVVFNYLDQTWYYGQMNRSSWLYSPLRQTPMSTSYNGQLIYQESGTNDGTTGTTNPYPINAYIQSSDFDIGNGNNFGFIYRLVPDVNFTGSTSNQPNVTMTFLPRQFSGSAYGTANNPSVASTQDYTNTREYVIQQFTPQVYVRARGRQMAFKVSSNTIGVAWQSGTNRLDIRPDGRR
jgi:hypothetical protein